MNGKMLFSGLLAMGAVAFGEGASGVNPPGPSAVVNVLTLGAKNDGSEDVSDIVNAHTGDGTLFFPAGLYKVAKPIYLKNPLRGEGYSRVPVVNASRTWLISHIECNDASVGVLNFSAHNQINLTELNIRCHSHECGIRIDPCHQMTSTFISKVGVYGMRSYGLFIKGGGSRPIFVENFTVFGSSDVPSPCVGIYNEAGVCDNRFNNIELMGIRVGMIIKAGFTYGNNMHIWTGSLGGGDIEQWWKDTRGIVLDSGAKFSGSQIYPDSCYYALEARHPHCVFDISNIMYWEDGSMRRASDHNGAFFHGPTGAAGVLKINGGSIGVGGNDDNPGYMRNVYTPSQLVRGVTVESDYAIRMGNLDRLCFGDGLPDYTLEYHEVGFCKVADIFAPEETGGACECTLSLGDGAIYRITCSRGARAPLQLHVVPLSPNCGLHRVEAVEVEQIVKVYVKNETAAGFTARLTTAYMSPYFRPLDHGLLRHVNGAGRWHEVLSELSAAGRP